MTDFLRKLWELARPYRVRLFLGVLTGVLSGLIGPLLIAIRMKASPTQITLEPGGQVLTFDYHAGIARLVVPRLEIHSIVMVE